MNIQQTFNLGLQHHQAGRLAEAEAIYRQILAQQPNQADALHLLGVVAHQVGRSDAAEDLIRRAIAARPNWPEAHSNLGEVLRVQGRLDEAIAVYHRAVALKPDSSEAYSNLAIALMDKRQLDDAIAACRKAIAIRPNYPEALNNLGNALRDKGELDQAISAYRQAISLRPNYAEAHTNLGVALQGKGKLDEAIASYRQSISLRPDYAITYSNFGLALAQRGLLDDAIVAFRRAIALKPNWPEAYCDLGVALKDKGQIDDAIAAYQMGLSLNPNLPDGLSNLGNALWEKGQIDNAIELCRKAIALRPDFAEAHSNLAIALNTKGELDEAAVVCRRAISLRPDLAEPHKNLGMTLLLAGDFPQGWAEYEWRWKVKESAATRQDFPQPQWDGSPTDGTIFLHAEQGFGDTLQFVRYVPMVAGRCKNVIVMCQTELHRLLEHGIAGDVQWLASGRQVPSFDVHCPLLSLPFAFQTTLETIPNTIPYLNADAEQTERWRERLANDGTFKIGIAWAGRPTHKNDRNRSVPLSTLAPLAEVEGVTFYSLQKGDRASQANNPPAGMHLIDLTKDINDFAATAALVANLDMVISVDTSIVHLAAAMGKPVWTLLPFVPDWRWLMKRDDTPWYPNMRLFRQPAIGEWDLVIRKVSDDLRKHLQG